MQNEFQEMAFAGDDFGGGRERRITFRGNDQSMFRSSSGQTIFNLNAADMAVVSGVQGVGQTQEGGQLDGGFLLVGEKIAKRFVLSGGQDSSMKAGDDGGALQVGGLPAQGVAVGANQVEGSFVMSLLAFGFSDIVQEGGGEQAGTGRDGVDGGLPSRGERLS